MDYVLQIPAKAEVRFETCNGKVVASGFLGTLSSDAVNGSIELAGLEGPTSASTVNGSVRVAFKGPLRKSRIETVNGSIDVAFAKASSVSYDLETVNGRIEGDFDLPVEGKFGPKEARGKLQRRRRVAPLRNGQRHDPPAHPVTPGPSAVSSARMSAEGPSSPRRPFLLALCYAAFLGFLPLLVEKRDPEVRWHARNGLALFGAARARRSRRDARRHRGPVAVVPLRRRRCRSSRFPT